jgi:hypothetical protein
LFRYRELFKTHTLARRGDGNAPYLQLALYGADAFFTHAEGPGSRAAAGIAEFVYIDSNAPPNQLAPIVQSRPAAHPEFVTFVNGGAPEDKLVVKTDAASGGGRLEA